MPDTRLIERWLPIAEIGEESTRERRSMTALPATYYLHVWWARRPLVASRAAVLASLLPADVGPGTVPAHPGDSRGSGRHETLRLTEARRRGERFEWTRHTPMRARSSHAPGHDDLRWLRTVFRESTP